MVMRARAVPVLVREPSIGAGLGARLDELCEFAPTDASREDTVFWFVRLVTWLRPRRGEGETSRARFLETQLDRNPVFRRNVAAALNRLVLSSHLDDFFASGGLSREFHLLGAIRGALAGALLPIPCDTPEVEPVLRLAFRESDLGWLRRGRAVTLMASLLDEPARAALLRAIKSGMLDLAHQLAAQAHAPSVRGLAPGARSPFRGLPDGVVAFQDAAGDPAPALAALRGRAGEARRRIDELRAELGSRGADLNTTFQLHRMTQQLGRLVTLAAALVAPGDGEVARLTTAIVRSSLRNDRGAHLLRHSSALLVQNLVDTTAEAGRSYLDASPSWTKALGAGLGGGAIMAAATIGKLLLAKLHLSPFHEGVAFSVNYGSAFVAAYLLHCTIATKLPANTAAALARCVQAGGGHRARLAAFAATWRATVRLQLAGLAGNVLAVVPLVLAVDAVVRRLSGAHLLSPAKAEHVVATQSILGPSLLFAALTGVFLWGSGLVGAACDNWARLSRLEEAFATSVTAMRTVGAARARVVVKRVVRRFGGVVGNATLGVLLGLVPALFAIVGLPVEIRHVTVSSASVALAAVTSDGPGLLAAVLGVVAIGVVNVAVSFALALWLALRPTEGAPERTSPRALARLGLTRWSSWRLSLGDKAPAAPSGA
jgi:site-specific recombinase